MYCGVERKCPCWDALNAIYLVLSIELFCQSTNQYSSWIYSLIIDTNSSVQIYIYIIYPQILQRFFNSIFIEKIWYPPTYYYTLKSFPKHNKRNGKTFPNARWKTIWFLLRSKFQINKQATKTQRPSYKQRIKGEQLSHILRWIVKQKTI